MSCECVGCVFGVALLNGVSLGCLAGVFLGSVLGASQEHLRGVTGISQGCLMFFLGLCLLELSYVVLSCFGGFLWCFVGVSRGCLGVVYGVSCGVTRAALLMLSWWCL